LKIYRYNNMSKDEWNLVMRRAELDISEHMKLAQEVAEDIRQNGDAAVVKYTEKYDHIKLTPQQMRVTEAEIEAGYQRLDAKTREAIAYAAHNIHTFHEKQLPEDLWFTYVDDGLMLGEKTTPIPNCCLYVPRGKGSFPSMLLMSGIPAKVAGVKKIVVVTPPNEQGNLDDSLLAAAKIIGVTELYKVGGIQAIAAVAHGTESIPKCVKVVGPGNSYVAAAKRVLSSYIDGGLPAGPSECIILADETADPEKVALDWMIEAEHGPDSAALLVTHCESLVEPVQKIVERQLAKISEKRREFVTTNFNTYGGIILTESLQQSIDFINEYAPEHMEIMTKDPFAVMQYITNAGEILLGDYTPVTLANFVLGINAILPTGAFAKTFSSLSVHDFLKRSSVGYVSKAGFEKVREYAYLFATVEGFDTHALAAKERV